MKILCFRNCKLGDYIISIPALKLIKDKHKNCDIYILSSDLKFYKSLPKKIENNNLVREFIFYENNFLGYLKLIKNLKKKKFDVIYNLAENNHKGILHFLRSFYHFFFFYIVGVKIKKGFFLKNLNYKKYNEMFQLTRRVDPKISKNKFKSLSIIKKKKEKKLLKFNYLTLSIGGFSQPRLWDINNWIKLTKLIEKNYNYKIIIIGTKNDIQNSELLSKINNKKIISLCGKLNLKKFFNIIKFTDLHITNDNGSMHLASLYDRKSICLFNNHDPIGKWYPINKNSHILRNKFGVNKISHIKVFKLCTNLI